MALRHAEQDLVVIPFNVHVDVDVHIWRHPLDVCEVYAEDLAGLG